MTQTRFYREVFQEGRQAGREAGRQEGEAALMMRLLERKLGALPEFYQQQVRSLPRPMLEALSDTWRDFSTRAD